MAGLVANAPNVLGTLQNLTAMGLYAAPPMTGTVCNGLTDFMLVVNWSNIRLDPAIFQITAMAMRMNRKIEDLGILETNFTRLPLPVSYRLKFRLPALCRQKPQSSTVGVRTIL